MSQVNVLAIDMPQVTESIGTFSSSNGAEQGANSAFSEVMAKHQQKESGNNPQQGGNKNVESSQGAEQSTTDNKQSADNVEIKAADKTDGVTEQNDSADIAEQSKEAMAKEGSASEEALAISESSNSLPSVDNTAEKLLSFIFASDEMSTESKAGDPANDDTLSKQANKLSMNPFGSLTMEGQKDQQGAQKAVDNSDVDVDVDVEANSLTNLISAATLKEKSDGGVSNQIASEEQITSDEQKATVAKTATDEQILNVGDEAGAEDIISSMEKVDDVEKPTTSLADKNSKEVLSQSIKSAEIDSDNTSKKVDVVVPVAAVEAGAEQKNVEAKANSQVLERSVSQNNAISESTSQNQSGSSQQGSGQSNGQSHAQSNEQQSSAPISLVSEEAVEGNQDIVDKKTVAKVNDIVTESALKATHVQDSLANKTLAEQSLSYAEEQSIQNVLARTNADSISAQSVKSAINIHNETIAIYRKDFSDAVKDKVMVMINQKIKQLEIRLDPPELGSMQVRLNLQNEQAAVSFVVQNQQAKEALEQNIGKLKEMLAESGIDVGDANIEQRSQQSSEQEEFAEQNSAGTGSAENETPEQQMSMAGVNLYKASATGVDYYA